MKVYVIAYTSDGFPGIWNEGFTDQKRAMGCGADLKESFGDKICNICIHGVQVTEGIFIREFEEIKDGNA